jgi:hypothetical protein
LTQQQLVGNVLSRLLQSPGGMFDGPLQEVPQGSHLVHDCQFLAVFAAIFVPAIGTLGSKRTHDWI